MQSLRLDRRGLLQAGAAGAAAVTVAGGWQLTEGVALAAPLPDHLRRATWSNLADGAFELLAGDRALPLRLTRVADLPVAASIPALRGHDGAFLLTFDGPAGIEGGLHRLRHAQLGELELFVAPVAREAATRSYEAVVDRTIRIAGINEEPVVVDPARVVQPSGGPSPAAVAASGAPVAGRRPVAPRRPRVTRAAVRRGTARRVAVAELRLADAGAVVAASAALRRDGRLVARATARPRSGPGGRRLRLRFAARRGRTLARGRHQLTVTLVARDGTRTTIRRTVTVA
ncbi:DUF6916 family protein [Conexibacter arvalis]|uniref:DUF6916 domain-containing protein n=1 Tax=Conexibacter arvalis TaxID=912552 RepID=A0A840IG38_9ACTN|nr:hypothetical protein [Conexibacter arvalis]MBB4663766.1 hypothetical protein [Conexibacter arvalis]